VGKWPREPVTADLLTEILASSEGDESTLVHVIRRAALAGDQRQDGNDLSDHDFDLRRLALLAAADRPIASMALARAEASLRGQLAARVVSARTQGREWYSDIGAALRGLAPETQIPKRPCLAAAWRVIVGALADAMPARAICIGRPPFLGDAMLEELRAEAAGLRAWGARSCVRPGPLGRRLAVSRELTVAVGSALGYAVAPNYDASLLFYTPPGDFAAPFAPHIDNDTYKITAILMLDRHQAADGSPGSALLAYRPDGSADRIELEPGELAVTEQGRVHAREPLKAGEQVTVLVIALAASTADRASPQG
jgi:hypothetical protein